MFNIRQLAIKKFYLKDFGFYQEIKQMSRDAKK